jgi:GNAT superfamily N-acetyltransferase
VTRERAEPAPSPTAGDGGVLAMLRAAAAGMPPPPDGAVEVLAPLPGPVDAVLGFTAHSVVVAGVDPAAVHRRLPAGDLGAPLQAPFLAWLADQLGADPGSLDVVLAAPGLAGVPARVTPDGRERVPPPGRARVPAPGREPPATARSDGPVPPGPDGPVAAGPEGLILPGPYGLALRCRPDLAGHARVARAGRFRAGIQVFADDRETVVLLVGRGLAGRWELAFEVEPGRRNQGLGRGLAAAARRLVPAGEPLFAQVAPGNAASLRAVLAAGFKPLGSEVLFLRPVGTSP